MYENGLLMHLSGVLRPKSLVQAPEKIGKTGRLFSTSLRVQKQLTLSVGKGYLLRTG